nr:SIS domain-containing protein [Acholeplasmatales bacterium]
MKDTTLKIVDELGERYPMLANTKDDVKKIIEMLETSYSNGGKLLLCGNGGSAADCNHIVGVLMKSFKKKRPIDAALKRKLKQIDEA